MDSLWISPCLEKRFRIEFFQRLKICCKRFQLPHYEKLFLKKKKEVIDNFTQALLLRQMLQIHCINQRAETNNNLWP